MKLLAVVALATLAIPISHATASETEAHASLNKRTARWAIRQLIRKHENVRPGSIVVDRCRKGYTRAGRRRILCDIYFESRDELTGRCGWGRVVQMRTFKRVEYNAYRC